jgi:hypothetical protein
MPYLQLVTLNIIIIIIFIIFSIEKYFYIHVDKDISITYSAGKWPGKQPF